MVAAYSLTMAMFIMSAATLADRHGRRRVYLGGLALFAVASALCGLAPSLPVLVIGRGLQGVGAAVVNVASLALVSAAFPDRKAKAKAIGLWTAIAVHRSGARPDASAAVLTESIGWRSVFFINVAVGVVGVVLAGPSSPSRATRSLGTSTSPGSSCSSWASVRSRMRSSRPARRLGVAADHRPVRRRRRG